MGWNPFNKPLGSKPLSMSSVFGAGPNGGGYTPNMFDQSWQEGGSLGAAGGSTRRYFHDRNKVFNYYTGHPGYWLSDALNGDTKGMKKRRQAKLQAQQQAGIDAMTARQLALAMGLPGGAAVGAENKASQDSLIASAQEAQAREQQKQAMAMQNLALYMQFAGAL